MGFFYYLRCIFNGMADLFGYKIMLGNFVLSIGAIFIGIMVLTASATLLNFLFRKD